MKFVVISNNDKVPNEGQDIGYLWEDKWDDWFQYSTLYHLTYFDKSGKRHKLGEVKIGQFDMADEQRQPDIPPNFVNLDERFFSLGQDTDYYSGIMKIGIEVANTLFSSLNDLAANDEVYQRSLKEDVTGISLLRSVNMKTVEGQFRRIINGDAELTDYMFRYVGPTPSDKSIAPIDIKFEVTPGSRPPTNIHVLIGRNGVGKTFMLNAMTRALVSQDSDVDNGLFISTNDCNEESKESPFANILSITFSAFDDFEIVPQKRNATEGVRYTNVGLRQRKTDDEGDYYVACTPDELAENFSKSAVLCTRGVKAERWRKALTTLEADPLFAEAEVSSLTNIDDKIFVNSAGQLYKRLSSGHKIVLLTITKLVENVEEKTLVLMDEPEAHLHPPLLAAFVRALSDLLINRNGVAIIATHSPVVLQEVPCSCVWKIVRHGLAAKATRPLRETFAENVGVLTKEIFGLEVTRSGFHKMITDNVDDEKDIRDVVAKFDNQVGSEGRALISSMIASKKH